MRTSKVPASTLHRTLADVAEILEQYTTVDNAAVTQWGLLDNGETLEIYHRLLEECRQCQAWAVLEQRYEAVGGNIYCLDDNEWEVA